MFIHYSKAIVTLNTRSLYAHIDDILQDEDLMNSMIICFQETRTDCPPKKNKILKYNFNTTYSVHGVLSCIDKNISIISTKRFSSHKVELVMSKIVAQRHLFIMNIYAARLAFVSSIIETISMAKEQIIDGDCIFIILGDFNIDIHVSSQRSKQLQEYMHSQHLQEITNKFTPNIVSQIDHIWTNIPFDHCEVNVLDSYWTDHDAIHALLHII